MARLELAELYETVYFEMEGLFDQLVLLEIKAASWPRIYTNFIWCLEQITSLLGQCIWRAIYHAVLDKDLALARI